MARGPEHTSRIFVVSPDARFAASVGGRLERWGFSVALESDLTRLTPALLAADGVDVVLLAVKRDADRALRWLSGLKRALPALEVILLNLAGEIGISIDGMRAGASQELRGPLDLGALRRALAAALRRRNRRRRGPSLLEKLERAMTAAAFAEAGEAETARALLEEDGAPAAGDPPAEKGRGREGR